MFKKILIIYSENLTEKHLSTLKKIEAIAKEKAEVNTVRYDKVNESFFKNIDLVITVGGDGTFIKASHFLTSTLIIGINSEPEISEGALCSIKESELDKLPEILNGKFSIIKRQRMRIILNKTPIKELALNDIYIGTEHQFHASQYKIKYKDKEEEQRSSGVLISTGSGSTAWYKSAGGTPFSYESKTLKFLVREPYKRRIFQSTIIHGEIKEDEKIEFESRRKDESIIALDSSVVCPFNYGSKAEITISENPLNVIVP